MGNGCQEKKPFAAGNTIPISRLPKDGRLFF
jgi:hypothetical protein